jgi:hypothetical protein
MTNGSGVMISASSGCGWNSFLDRTRYLENFGIWAYFQWKTRRTLNTEVIENFITLLTKGRTQNFYFDWRSHGQLKLIGPTIYDFPFESISIFLSLVTFVGLHGFQSSSYWCTCICEILTKCGSYMFLTKRKALPNIDGVHIIGGKSHSPP